MERTLCVRGGKTAEWFKQWFDSEYYHLLYGNRDEKEAERFTRKLVDKLEPSGGLSMLDMGYGRGRHARMLNSMGFDVTGLDLSGSSIKAAQRYNSNSLRFWNMICGFLLKEITSITYLVFHQFRVLRNPGGKPRCD